jgi:hypothetical protein
VDTPKSGRQRRLHKALLRYHDPEGWPLIREALRAMGRADLIGASPRHLVPRDQPVVLDRGQASGKASPGAPRKSGGKFASPVGSRRGPPAKRAGPSRGRS